MSEADERFYTILKDIKRSLELQPRLNPRINLINLRSPFDKKETESIISTLLINWQAFAIVCAPKETVFVKEDRVLPGKSDTEYLLSIKYDNFLRAYDLYYNRKHFDLDKLSPPALLKLANAIHMINDQRESTLSSMINLRPDEATDYYWAYHGSGTASKAKITDFTIGGLNDLCGLGALEQCWIPDKNKQSVYKIEIDSHRYDSLSPKILEKALPFLKLHLRHMNNTNEFAPSIERLMLLADEIPLGKPKDFDDPKAGAAFSIDYDHEHAIASYAGKSEKLFDTSTIMSVLTHRAILADGARVRSSDIVNEIEALRVAPDKEISTKALTNAKDRINRRLQELFGIGDVIEYERQEFWLNMKYCSEKSPYKMASNGN